MSNGGFRFRYAAFTLLGLAGAAALPALSATQRAAPKATATRPTAAATRPSAEPLVTFTRGTLPIILTAPHDGMETVPGTPPRTGVGTGVAPNRFVIVRDVNTGALTEAIGAAMERELGGRPYVVIARFHRRFIDANRPPADGFEHPGAKPHYDAFHGAIDAASDEIRRTWGRGLLLDIHGQIAEVDGIYRGTRDGRTVSDLLRLHGDDALVGPQSILGRLAAEGYMILPPPPPPPATPATPATRASSQPATAPADIGHEIRFNGGYIVDAHGSHRGTAIDAIQLEFGTNLRRKTRIEQTANDVAKAAAAFARAYLPAAKLDRDVPAR
jgi:N-formylglutamate amidohydrolase